MKQLFLGFAAALFLAVPAFPQGANVPPPSGGGAPTGAAGGDLSGTYPNHGVAKINGVALSGLATGIVKNTTGVPSIAVPGDFPTLNQSTTGNAATATDAAKIGGVAVTGTPSTGQVPTATGSAAATWQTPAGGGSPGGADGALQYNNAGAPGGADYVSIANGSLTLIPVPDPTVPPTVALAGLGAGNVDNGTHCYAYAYFTDHGYTRTNIGPDLVRAITIADNSVDGQVNIVIPASGDSRVVDVYVFRTFSGVSCTSHPGPDLFYLVAQLGSNGGTLIDNQADAAITAETILSDGIIRNTTSLIGNLRVSSDGGVDLQGSFGWPYPGIIQTGADGSPAQIFLPNDPTQFLNGTGAFSSITLDGRSLAGTYMPDANTILVTDSTGAVQQLGLSDDPSYYLDFTGHFSVPATTGYTGTQTVTSCDTITLGVPTGCANITNTYVNGLLQP
jgi:hypothetical protein